MRKDIELLEEEDYSKKCKICKLKPFSINGDWCFCFVEAPAIPCDKFIILDFLREGIELSNLIKKYPNLE